MTERRYFRRNFDMHWTDGYSLEELAARDRNLAVESRRKSTLDNIVAIIEGLNDRLDALEASENQGARGRGSWCGDEDPHAPHGWFDRGSSPVDGGICPGVDRACISDADFLAMQQRAEAAERERDEWKAEAARAWSDYSRKLDELVERTGQRDAARAAVERLREALVVIEDTGSFTDPHCVLARAALAEALKETTDG